MNLRKILFIYLILILFLIPVVSASEKNIVFLKAGNIDTDLIPEMSTTDQDRIKTQTASEMVDTSEKYYIVQFEAPVTREWKNMVTDTGAEIFDYVPDNAFVLRMNGTEKDIVAAMGPVRWIGEYLPDYKYISEINTDENGTSNENENNADLIIFLFDPEDNTRIISEILSAGGILLENSDEVLRINIPEDMISELVLIKGISWIERTRELSVSNNVATDITSVNTVRNNLDLKGKGQIVAVCDTGLDTGRNDDSMHADIRGRILSIMDHSVDGAQDPDGHGTHVTGSVLGNGTMSDGKYSGMAPEATLVFQAIGTDSGKLKAPINLNTLFQPAYDAGARIHTNSWGTDSDGTYDAYSYYADMFSWNHPDMLLLFSAGNDGKDLDDNGVTDPDSLNTPATSKNCIAVGASESYRGDTFSVGSYSSWGNRWPDLFATNPLKDDYMADDPEGIAAFSSRGPTDDGRIKPDIVAPGTFIISTRSSNSSAWYDWDNNDTGEYYAYSGGTSMSTPIVAGSAALVREYYTEMAGIADPSAALLKATLLNGAYDLTPGQYDAGDGQEINRRPDISQGWGRLDIKNSIVAKYPEVIAYYDDWSLSTSESWNHTYEYLERGKAVRATLVWTDYPSLPYSGKALVNDLDLTIKGPWGTYYGNNGPDHINNVEGIEIAGVDEGTHTITVEGYSVTYGPQPFALVSSFTCDNKEFPENGSLTDNSTTAVSTYVVHPAGVNLSSITMKINETPVSFSSENINDGHRIQYDTPEPYENGKYNVSVMALTDKGQEFAYSWEFNVDAHIINNAPVLEHIGNREINGSETLTIELYATDYDGDALDYATNASFGTMDDNNFTWTPDHSDYGKYSVEFNVTDGIDTDSETIIITVENVDRPPVLDPIGNITVQEDEPLSFTIRATDPDGDNVTYSAKGLPTGAVLNETSGNFSWTPGYDDSGTYNATFIVSDGEFSDSETISITVNNIDRAPVLDQIGDKEIGENSLLSFNIYANDPDQNDTITYSAIDLPEGAGLDPDSGEFEWIPGYEDQGNYYVEFIASSNDLDDSEMITITVINVNREPELDPIGPQNIIEDRILKITLSASDDDGDELTYYTNATFGNLTDEIFQWTPDFNDSGTYSVEFSVYDGIARDSEIVIITVDNFDRGPELTSIADRTINENETLNFIISGTDPDGDTVTYSATNMPEEAVLDATSGEFTWIPVYNHQGTYDIGFTAEANGLNDSETVTITVLNVDRPPVLDPIGNMAIHEDELLSFIISGTDPDGETVTYSASDIPEGAGLDPVTGEFNWDTDHDDAGNYNVSFTASATGLKDSENVTIIVENVDREPELETIGDKTGNENETLSFTISAADPDGDLISYYATGLPDGAEFNSSKGYFNWTPEYNDSGTYDIEFTASSNGLADNETITITIEDVNIPPEFTPIPTLFVEVTKDLRFTVNATDMDGDHLNYSVSGALPDGAAFNDSSLLFNWTPTANQTGNYSVNFTVTDDQYHDNLTVPIVVTELSTVTTTASTSTTSGGGSGGGGGGTTGEDFDNIELKDVSSLFVGKGMDVRFEFRNEDNDILYVGYGSLKNAGTISVTIEMLKDRSVFADSMPAGTIYRNINIWVGKTGYAIESNIEKSVIGFRVDRDWIYKENIDPDTVVLNRYEVGWTRLPTTQTGDDEEYLYFQADTPGFSPFAITGETMANEEKLSDVTDTGFSIQENDVPGSSVSTSAETQPGKTVNSVPGLVTFLIITFVCFLTRKQ